MTDIAELAQALGLAPRRVPIVLQSEAGECGLACLVMIGRYHGHRIDLASARRRLAPSARGVSLSRLLDQASALHLGGRPLRLELKELTELATPCILHWDLSHFVVLVRARRGRVLIHDPAVGRRVYSEHELSRHFTGVALELVKTSTFEAIHEERPARIRDLWSRSHGFVNSMLIVLGLSSMLQVVAMAAPFYTQLVVDHVLTRNDQNLLVALACGFGLLLLVQAAISLLREYTVLYLGNVVSFQMSANLLSHLIRLPLQYFERRHLGDVMSRFGSLSPIESLITTGFVSVLIDGVMAVGVLALMFAYSPKLAALAIAAVLVCAVLRIVLYQPLRQIREQAIVAQAQESTTVIELLSGIQAIKLLSAEARREALWQNRHADSVNAGVRAERYSLGFQTANSVLLGAEQVIAIYLGAHLVLENVFSVGMLYAYLSYKTQFIGRVSSLIDWVLRFRMLDVPLSRLADIVHTPEEPGLRGGAEPHVGLRGRIELRGVGFRYAASEPYVLRDVSLVIEAGSCVGIVGRSGGGKTTLLKLMLGLLEPTEGEILIDGQKLGSSDISWYRKQVGAVMQEDRLLQGTIAENISAFDPDEDIRRVESAARAACVHEDIAAFPLGYATLISTMGSSLSGGQRQRVLLARALYRHPRVLVLDEGTAHLDPAITDAVWTALMQAQFTRIIASHQAFPPDSVHAVLHVENGRVVRSLAAIQRRRDALMYTAPLLQKTLRLD